MTSASPRRRHRIPRRAERATSACPGWAVTKWPRSPARSARGRSHAGRGDGLGPGRGPRPLQRGGVRSPPRQAAAPRRDRAAPARL